MATTPQPPSSATPLPERWRSALDEHLAAPGEASLGRAYELGRTAIEAGHGFIDLVGAHHAALTAALPGAPDQTALVAAAEELLREAAASYELAYRGYQEVQEVARLEHEQVRALDALSAASLDINRTFTTQEIAQRAADAAREVTGAATALVTAAPPTARTPGVVATSPGTGGGTTTDTSTVLQRPLVGQGGRELGKLEVRGAGFTKREEALVAQLALLTASALTNANLYEQQARIAHTLQRSLLPGALPQVPGLPMAVRFTATGEGVEVGGDFYDAFAIDEGWAVLVGDVCGKGPEAAAVTAVARQTLRTAARYEGRPSKALLALHHALEEQRGDDRFCTVAFSTVHLRPDGSADLVLSLGGHPSPLVVRAAGGVEAVGRLGTLLGSSFDPRVEDVEVRLEVGDVLVLYTDGVTDVRRGGQELFGVSDLVALLETLPGASPEQVAERVHRAALGAADRRANDDIAILALGPSTS